MSLFDQVYDEMSWVEVCNRLPSDLAINALKRRVNNLDTLRMLIDNIGNKASNIPALKTHINDIISDHDVDEILNTFESKYHPSLFAWLEKSNVDRIKKEAKDKLDTVFLFNLTDSDDQSTLEEIMDRVLQEPDLKTSRVLSVLRKSDDKCLAPLLDKIIKDKRPEVRACILSVSGFRNTGLVSDHQKVIGLKALTKCGSYNLVPIGDRLGINVFSNLRPFERLKALEYYMTCFPKFKKVKVFDPEPTEEEFKMILFAGCIEHNDLVAKLNKTYEEITKLSENDIEDK